MKNKHTRRGFTLIELLVVVLIIGILAAVALPQYNKAVEKSRIAEMQTILADLEKAAEMHRITKGIDDEFNPLTDGDIDYSSQFSYDEGKEMWCNQRKICVFAYNRNVYVRNYRGGEEYDYYQLQSDWADTENKWKRKYASCGVDINSYGLENLGYERLDC